MPNKRLLYFTSERVDAYSWKAGVITAEGIFENNEQGLPEFSKYIATDVKALYYLLIDIVEENVQLIVADQRIERRHVSNMCRNCSASTSRSGRCTALSERRRALCRVTKNTQR